MCGEYGASRCSAEKWFEFMGDAKGNPYVPFQITYKAQPDNRTINGSYIPLNPTIIPCNKAIDVSNLN